MFRLTVGRRLALVVTVAIFSITLLVLNIQREQSAESLDRTTDQMHSIATPLASFIENELENASRVLEAVAENPDDTRSLSERLEPAGFITAESVGPDDPSKLDASSNFITRASADTTIGATKLLNDEAGSENIGVLIGTPIPGSEQIVIGAYDVSGILVGVSGVQSGESTEALLAVRNSEGEPIIFSPSRHRDDETNWRPDEITTEIIERVLDGEDSLVFDDVDVNGRESIAAIRRIPQVEWALIVATDRSDAGVGGAPWWMLPAFLVIGIASLIPIALLRNRLKSVARGAQELYRDRLTSPLDDQKDDEIGMLSRTLQSLDDRLQTESDQRGRSAAALQHRASHDPLTGLANRGKLVEELTVALNTRDPVAILFCDIDNFKGINDSQGHQGGDIVLKHVANQLATVCGPSELIARFGGDEFCVLTRSDGQAARQLAIHVERALDSTAIVNGNQLRIGGSVGLAIAKVTDTPDSLLKIADLAMYREKERRRGLRRAAGSDGEDVEISVEQIRLVYQPVVDVFDASIIGVEVLARYMHPVLGMLDPSSFLPPGTEPGMFDKFDLEILTRSLAQLSEWLGDGVVDERFTLSFNLKPDHVSGSDSSRKIFEILRQERIPASMLQIEVTEHRLHTHADDLMNSLHNLRERGVKIAIDDFGVEGSNVDRLVQIPCDTVKIDRSFVSEIDTDDRAEARLKAILEIVATDSLVPIAEGVERTAQAEVLQRLGVQYGQGYLWHAPISALALTPLLGRASRWTRRRPPPVAGNG